MQFSILIKIYIINELGLWKLTFIARQIYKKQAQIARLFWAIILLLGLSNFIRNISGGTYSIFSSE